MFALDGIIRRQLQAMIGEAGSGNVKVSGGCVLIEDVHFDESAIEDLIFPPTDANVPAMKLKTLHVKKLAVNIPWGNFSKGFVDVELDGLSVCLQRRSAEEVTVEMLRARKEACVAELMAGLVETVTTMAAKPKKKKDAGGGSKDDKEGKGSGSGGGGGSGGMVGKMIRGAVRKILESFRPIIRLSNVHIRYEDLAADAASRLAIGATIGKLIIQHPDSPFSEIDEDPNMQPVKDVVDLEVAVGGLGVYMHLGSMGAETVVGGGPAANAAAVRAAANAPALTGAAAKRAAASNGGEDDRTVEAMGKLFGQLMRGETPYGAQQWIVSPIAISGKIHVNVGLFIGERGHAHTLTRNSHATHTHPRAHTHTHTRPSLKSTHLARAIHYGTRPASSKPPEPHWPTANSRILCRNSVAASRHPLSPVFDSCPVPLSTVSTRSRADTIRLGPHGSRRPDNSSDRRRRQ